MSSAARRTCIYLNVGTSYAGYPVYIQRKSHAVIIACVVASLSRSVPSVFFNFFFLGKLPRGRATRCTEFHLLDSSDLMSRKAVPSSWRRLASALKGCRAQIKWPHKYKYVYRTYSLWLPCILQRRERKLNGARIAIRSQRACTVCRANKLPRSFSDAGAAYRYVFSSMNCASRDPPTSLVSAVSVPLARGRIGKEILILLQSNPDTSSPRIYNELLCTTDRRKIPLKIFLCNIFILYIELPVYRTFFVIPLRFDISGFDCIINILLCAPSCMWQRGTAA